MVPPDWSRYWVDQGWVQAACLVGTVIVFTLARLGPRLFAAIDYAVHFHGAGSTHDGALSMPSRRSVPFPYRASVRVMNTGRFDICESDLPGGAVITVHPTPRLLIGLVATVSVARGTVTLEPQGPARMAVMTQRLRPGDWVDVDLLTDRPVSIRSVSAHLAGRRARRPWRRRLRPYDGTQLALDLIGLPIALAAMALVGRALPGKPATLLDVAASFGWLLLAVWAVMSLWGLMDQCVRYTARRRWPGHPRVFLRWGDPAGENPAQPVATGR